MPHRLSSRQSTWLMFRSRVVIGMSSARSPFSTRSARACDRVDFGHQALEAAADGPAVHRRIHPGVDWRVGHAAQALDVVERIEILARAVPVDQQVIDDGIRRQGREPGFELLRRQAGQVGDRESTGERPELFPCHCHVFERPRVSAGDDEHVPHLRLHATGQVERGGEVQMGDHRGGIRDAWGRLGGREEHDGRAGKQVVPAAANQLEREILHRDDEIEVAAVVFHAQELAKAVPVFLVGKPGPVDVLGVVIEDLALPQALFEGSRHLALADDRDLRVPVGGIENEHFASRRPPPRPAARQAPARRRAPRSGIGERRHGRGPIGARDIRSRPRRRTGATAASGSSSAAATSRRERTRCCRSAPRSS